MEGKIRFDIFQQRERIAIARGSEVWNARQDQGTPVRADGIGVWKLQRCRQADM